MSKNLIIKCITVGLFEENTYIVGCGKTKDAILIDPGDNPKTIIKEIENLQLNVKAILNTHCHIDHIGAVFYLKENLKVQFLIHSKEVPVLKAAEDTATFFGIKFKDVPCQDETLDKNINSDENFSLGEQVVKVLFTPGHTPGGCCFLIGKNLFSGDTLFAGSVGRTDLPGGSYETLIKSIKTQILTLPDDTIIYSGHGPESVLAEEKKYNPFLVGM